jgi:sulfatase maturation enzyme AslB (radical SAM superfamily)
MPTLTLARAGNPLASASRQLEILAAPGHKPFEASLAESGHGPLRAAGIQILQVNVGKMCNQTCRHCHVDAGPDRREVMTRETMQQCLDAMAAGSIATLDIT